MFMACDGAGDFTAAVTDDDIVTWRLKAGIVESGETSIARKRLGKQVSGATDAQATIDGLLGTIFFCSVRVKWL
jgi:hypothetical protein